MNINISRKMAWKLAKELKVEYQVSFWGQDWETKTRTLTRQIVAQSIYRLQSVDEQKIADYAVFWLEIGDDSDDIGLGGITVID